MAIKTRIVFRDNHLTKEKVASANIVDLHQMSFTEFCDYMAQDSTVGVADVMAVMTRLEKKLPLLLAPGTKVQGVCRGHGGTSNRQRFAHTESAQGEARST